MRFFCLWYAATRFRCSAGYVGVDDFKREQRVIVERRRQ